MLRNRSVPLALRTCFIIGACLAMTACTTEEKRTADKAAVKKAIAAEIDRICALPEAERAEALARLRKESGFELQCARP